jgi:hypothetical protein
VVASPDESSLSALGFTQPLTEMSTSKVKVKLSR